MPSCRQVEVSTLRLEEGPSRRRPQARRRALHAGDRSSASGPSTGKTRRTAGLSLPGPGSPAKKEPACGRPCQFVGSLWPPATASSSAGTLDVACLLAFGALRNVEGDLLAFLERLEALHVDRREMREQVFAAAVRRDEAKALCVVEPLDGTSCHTAYSF